MAMLADTVELVIGVDPHKHPHTAVAVAATTGAVVEQATVPATPAGDSCCGSPTGTTVDGCGRSRAPAATAPA